MANGGTGGGAPTGGQTSVGAGGQVTGQATQVAEALSEWTPTPEGEPTPESKVEGPTPKEGKPKVEEPAPKEEEPKEGEPKEGEPPEETPEVSTLKAQVKILQDNYDKLLAGFGKQPDKRVEPEPPPTPEKFVASQEDMDKALDKPEEFNSMLNKVHNKSVESVLKVLPAVIDNMVRVQLSLRGKITDFYNTHKDLVPHKQFVGYVVNDLMGKNPNWDLDKVFTELPKEVRQRIGLKQQAESKAKRGGFAPRGSGARPPATHSKEPTGLEEEIADLVITEELK